MTVQLWSTFVDLEWIPYQHTWLGSKHKWQATAGEKVRTLDAFSYCNFCNNPPSEISPPPFLNEVVAKGCFSLESMPTYLCHSTYCYVEQEAVLEGLTNEGWHHLHKQMYDKTIADSLHAYINRARPTTCKVGILHIFERISQLLTICPPSSLRSHFSSSPISIPSRAYGNCFLGIHSVYIVTLTVILFALSHHFDSYKIVMIKVAWNPSHTKWPY